MQTNELVQDWCDLYKSLTKREINIRINEIKNSTEKVPQKIFQLRALEVLMSQDNHKVKQI